jgi:hypothetical protein
MQNRYSNKIAFWRCIDRISEPQFLNEIHEINSQQHPVAAIKLHMVWDHGSMDR